MMLLVAFLVLLLGLLLLLWSADKFVNGAVAIAHNFGVSKIIIGLTVVSVGTSAPEILVSTIASLEGAPDIAIGNAIGSNIANIGLVLGVTAIIAPLPFATSVLRFEMPWLLLATLLVAVVLLYDRQLGMIDGILLLVVLIVGLTQMFRRSSQQSELPTGIEEELVSAEELSRIAAVGWLIVGLLLLLLAAQMVVWGAIHIAEWLGVPNMVIALTIVALGTSLPELAATVTAALKKHPEIAIGNVVGSNILNILAVLPVPALIHPYTLSTQEVWRDFGAMFAFTLLLALFAYGIRSRKIVTRFEGVILLLGYIGYTSMLVFQTIS